MSLIDQRILVAAPTDAVWTYLVTPSSMLKWNHLTQQLSILSTHPTGVGARRRSQDARGQTIVEEITAWLENIGLEYQMVDGPYRSMKGRFRLQAVPEGTVVNWIVEYQLKGPLAGARDMIGFRRGYQRMMIESLRDLRKMVEASGVQLDPDKQARFAMQADPGVEARAARNTPEGKPAPRAERVVLPPSERPAMKPVVIDEDAELELDTTLLPAMSAEPKQANPKAATAEVVAFLKQQWAKDAKDNDSKDGNKDSAEIPAATTPNAPAILHAFTPPTPAPVADAVPASNEIKPTLEQPAFVAKLEAESKSSTGGIRIEEPPISKEDTRPRKTLQGVDHLPGLDPNGGTPAIQIEEPPRAEDDTPVSGTGRIKVQASEPSKESAESEAHRALTVPISMVAPTPPPSPATQTMEVLPTPPASSPPTPLPPASGMPRPESLPERLPTPPMIVLNLSKHVQIEDPDEAMIPDADELEEKPAPTAHHDTGEVSIWDAFGLESPTQRGLAVLNEVVAQARATAEMAAVSAADVAGDSSAVKTDKQDKQDKHDSQPVAAQPSANSAAHTPAKAITRRAAISVRGWHGQPRQKHKLPNSRDK